MLVIKIVFFAFIFKQSCVNVNVYHHADALIVQKERYDKVFSLMAAAIALNTLFYVFDVLVIENYFEYSCKLKEPAKIIVLEVDSSNNSTCSDLSQSFTDRAYEFVNYCPKNKCMNSDYVYFVEFEKKEKLSINIMFEYDMVHKNIVYRNDIWSFLKLDESNLKIIKIQDVLRLKCFEYDVEHNLLLDNNVIFKNIKGKLITNSDSELLKHRKRLKKSKQASMLK